MGGALHSHTTLKTIYQQLRRVRGVAIFDFDGVLADTESLHAQAYIELLASHGITFGLSEFTKYMGNSEENIYARLNTDYGIALRIDVDKPKRLDIFRSLADLKNLEPSVIARFFAEKRDIRCHIVSSQDQIVLEELLTRWKMHKQFLILTPTSKYATKRDMVPVFGDMLHLAPAQVFHFEDNGEVIKLSHNQGYKTIFVRHALNKATTTVADWEIALF